MPRLALLWGFSLNGSKTGLEIMVQVVIRVPLCNFPLFRSSQIVQLPYSTFIEGWGLLLGNSFDGGATEH